MDFDCTSINANTISHAVDLATPQVALGVVVLVGFLVLVVLSRLGSSNRNIEASKRYWQEVKNTTQDAIRWAQVCEQDVHPLTALAHASMSVTLARNARKMASPEEIRARYQVDIDEFITMAERLQQTAQDRILRLSPELQQRGVFAVSTVLPEGK